MAVRSIGETVEHLRPVPPPEPAPAHLSPELLAEIRQMIRDPEPRVVTQRVLPDKEILAAMSGLGAVLAVRVMLLLAIVGAFALAYMAMHVAAGPTGMSLSILMAYTVTVVAPLVWLSTKRT